MTNRVVRLCFFLCLLAPIFIGCASSPSAPSTTTTPPPTTPAATAPTVSSVAPSTVVAGASATAFTVTGTGYTSQTTVQVNGTVDPTTFVSATQLTVSVPATQLAQGSILSVIALDGNLSSAAGAAVNLEVDNPKPSIAQIVPATINTASPALSIAITGSGFVPTTVIQVGGSPRPTAFVNSTQVTVTLTAADSAAPASLSLTAINPSPGGGSSSAASIAVNNAAPGRISLNPATVATGTASPSTITVTGSNFLPASTVQVGIPGGTAAGRATTYVSATQLTFQLTAADQAVATTFLVSVVTPAPGGGTSATALLHVAAPSLTAVLTSVSPTQFIVGSAESQLTVSGTNLDPTDVVQWNGTPLQTFYFTNLYPSSTSTSFLLANVPASLLTSAGTFQITVTSPTAPAVSNALPVTVANPPVPTLTQIFPSNGPINTSTPLTLTGTGFTAASTVSLNGANLPATFVNSTELTVTIPASTILMPGVLSVTVTTPAPGGGTTAPAYFTASIPIVNNSMVYNPANGLFYVSVPSSAGAPYGNSVVSVDPETGALGVPIPVGSEPDRLAVSSDGTILWVALDGASAVRQINLTTNTAGLQFSFGGNAGIYDNPPTVLALAALPGSPNSVVVSTSNLFSNLSLAIYDNGVLRGTTTSTNSSFNSVYALQVDGSRSEIYAGGSSYDTYTYNSAGLTLKAASSTPATYATYSSDEIQVANGVLYTDFGAAYDAESGSLLGTFYASGSTPATGPTTADTTLGKLFVLDSSASTYSSNYNQIQVFKLADYTTASTIPISVTATGNSINSSFVSRLTRWGTNGLAFRTGNGVYSLRSNLVKDLSSTSADLGVTLAASGPGTTGNNTTYTATVTNAGPSASTNIALTAVLPSTGVLISATPSVGTCSSSNGLSCDLGGLANGTSATITFVIQQISSGSAVLTVQVSGSENDPTPANNQATSTQAITGDTYNLPPTLAAINPAAIATGSGDTVVTLTGTGFAPGSTVRLGSTALATNVTSSTVLTATVPSASAATLGWQPVTVSSPSPGGGTSTALPLSFFSVITLGVNHMLYDPYSRNIMASVGSGSSSVTGNSIVAITPDTASVGQPVSIGSQPTNLALTSDGQILYTILSGSQSVARFNMLTQQLDFTYAVPSNSSFDGGIALRGVATQPGTEDTVALDLASFTGNAIYDFNPATKTAAIRGQASGPYSGSCLQFLDAADLLAFDIDTSGSTLDHYTVTSAGFTYYDYQQTSTLDRFGCFKLSGGLAFANAGGVANPATVPATQLGVFQVSGGGEFSNSQTVAPDTSLQRAFFLAPTSANSSTADGIVAFNNNTFLQSGAISLNLLAIEGNNAFSGIDLIRWGQDGLALLTSTGHIYLLRGAGVVPQLLTQNSAATLTQASSTSATHGAGNTVLTLTGTNFIPGVAAQWNGGYRTTTIVDPTHLTVAIPASDLAASGTATLTVVNPNAPASSGITFTIN